MFLLADLSIEIILRMFYLTFSNIDVSFAEQELIWRSYITAKALPITKWIKIINKKNSLK